MPTRTPANPPPSTRARIARAFVIGKDRLFDEDPRFGLVVLAEIADKALSPGVNDSGTAIAIIGSLARLLVLWAAPVETAAEPTYDKSRGAGTLGADMFDDAFTPIARDGAGAVEVVVRLQKALSSLASHGDASMQDAARAHGRMALARAGEGHEPAGRPGTRSRRGRLRTTLISISSSADQGVWVDARRSHHCRRALGRG